MAAFQKNQRVLVKLRGGRGDQTAQPGVVKELAGGGAFVQLASGNRNFFYTSDISPDNTPATPATPMAAVAKQTAPPHFATKPPPKIGALMRAEREVRGIQSGVAARELGIKLAELERIEHGEDLPSEDLVLRFSEVFNADLGELEAALLRAGGGDPKPKPGPVLVPPLPPAPALTAPPPKPATVPAPAPAPAATVCTFERFVDQLDAVVPLPPDRTHRAKWFELARALHELAGGP